MARAWPRFGLRSQIAALGMGGVILLGGIYTAGLRTQERHREAGEVSARLASDMAAVADALTNARQVETEFLLKRQDKLIPAREALVAKASEHLEAVERAVSSLAADDPLRRVETVRAGLNYYATRFQNVAAAQRTLGFSEKEGLQSSLLEAVHAVETRLTAFDQPRLAVLMLMMRRHEKDFMLRGDETYGDQLRDRVREFGPALAATALPVGVKVEIGGLVKAYEGRFMAFLVGASTLKEEADDLASAFVRVRGQMVETKAEVERRHASTREEIDASRATTTWLMWWTIGLTVAAAGGLSAWIGRRISTPLATMAAAMERLAGGDLTVTVPRVERRDEIGAIARAFGVFHARIVENRDLTVEQTAARLRGEAERREGMLALAARLEDEVGRAAHDLSEAAAAMRTNAERVSAAIDETHGRAGAAVAAAGETSANVQVAAAAAEELTGSIGEVAARIAHSAEVTERAGEAARRTHAKMRDLSEAATRIGDVIVLISTIASQTNLLALNATIEAARAGEAGRGFAIVASEVKDLATQTAQATQEIRSQIEAIQGVTGEAMAMIGGIAGTMGEMDEIASAIAAAIQQQQAAAQDIAGSVVMAAQGTEAVSARIEGVGIDSDRASEAARGVLVTAQGLSERSADLQSIVGRFLAQLRAA